MDRASPSRMDEKRENTMRKDRAAADARGQCRSFGTKEVELDTPVNAARTMPPAFERVPTIVPNSENTAANPTIVSVSVGGL